MAKYGNIVRVPGVDPTLAQSIFAEGAGDSQMLAEALRGASQEDIAETQAEASTRQALISSEAQKDVAEERSERAQLQANAQLQMTQQEMAQRQREAEIKQGIVQKQLDAKKELAEARRAANDARWSESVEMQKKYTKRYMDAMKEYRKQQRASKIMSSLILLSTLEKENISEGNTQKALEKAVEAGEEDTQERRTLQKKIDHLEDKADATLEGKTEEMINRKARTKLPEDKFPTASYVWDITSESVKDLTGKSIEDMKDNPEDVTMTDILTARKMYMSAKERIKNKDVPWMTDIARMGAGIVGSKTVYQEREEASIKKLDDEIVELDTILRNKRGAAEEKAQKARDALSEKGPSTSVAEEITKAKETMKESGGGRYPSFRAGRLKKILIGKLKKLGGYSEVIKNIE